MKGNDHIGDTPIFHSHDYGRVFGILLPFLHWAPPSQWARSTCQAPYLEKPAVRVEKPGLPEIPFGKKPEKFGKNIVWFLENWWLNCWNVRIHSNWQKRNLRVASSKPSLRLRLHASAVAWLFQRRELLPGNTNMFNVVSPWKLESDFDKTTMNIPLIINYLTGLWPPPLVSSVRLCNWHSGPCGGQGAGGGGAKAAPSVARAGLVTDEKSPSLGGI